MRYYHNEEFGSYDQEEQMLIKKEPSSQPKEEKSWGGTIMRYSLVIIAVLAMTMVLVTRKSQPSTNNSSFEEIFGKSTTTFSVDVKVTSPGYGELSSLSMLPWDAIAEPHREQTIYLDNFVLDGSSKTLNDDNYDINWTINKQSYSGKEISVKLTQTGVLDCVVTISPKAVAFTLSQSFTLAVKYVRRELRNLTDADRVLFFDALNTMYTVDSDTGKALYGEKFNTAAFFLARHLNGAATTDCDHWHDGAGIVTHHVAYTLEVEQCLQAIAPSLAMPYWEYGLDPTIYDNFADSPIFNKDWFGEASGSADTHAIADGSKWASITMPSGEPYKKWSIKETGTLNPFMNAYGTMRSPWNNNPDTHIGRHSMTYSMSQYKSMPSCRDLRSCFQSDNMADLNDCINGYTHGPVHIMIGGAWNEGSVFDSNTVGFVRNPDKLLFFKVLWRLGFTRCPTSCEVGAVCKCSVPDEYIKTYGALNILKISNIYYALERQLSTANDAVLLATLRAVEDPGVVGEMFTSGASFDPTFWPLHGAAERLVSYKRLLVSSGVIADFDSTWGYPTYNKASGAAYLNGKCDWSKVASAEDLTLPTCSFDEICYGHNEDDLLEFTNFLNNGETYTNKQFMAFIDPENDDLPYTYDTYAFSFCDALGYDFLDTSSTSAGESVTPTDPIASGGGGKSSSTIASGTIASGTIASGTTSSSSIAGKTTTTTTTTSATGVKMSTGKRRRLARG